ncbi:MAG TPA: PLP-dependent aminotransferase family protein [Candidatus Aquilonibacter sp.]|nr:PLP-dependent aminotransferase family protein [Candidatus Aquilonibacter sp.]
MKSSALSKLGRRTALPPISWLMQTALTRPKLISLAAGFTDNPTLPVEISRKLLNEILRDPKIGQPALQYGITAGEMNLRELTARRLRKMDLQSSSSLKNKSRTRTKDEDEIYSAGRLMITGGSQQLLYMTLEALCDEGDLILVEDPTYFVFLSILQSRGLRARGVKLERDGIDLAHLENVLERLKKSGELRRVKALYLVSYFQNPTGVTTSFAKKAGVLKLLKKFSRAAGHPIYLLEDAAYRELRFAGDDTPSALVVPGAGANVIYTGTYSKPYGPGVRVGFGILPAALFTVVERIKGNHDFGTANLLQQLLARALETGLYDRHVAKIEKRYGEKARVMKQALAEHFPPGVEIWESGGGLYFWARLPEGISAGVNSKVFQTALKNDVLYVPGELCYADDPSRPKPDNGMRISFGSASEENIREGIARLGKVLKKIKL